jgi:hypothetical protein
MFPPRDGLVRYAKPTSIRRPDFDDATMASITTWIR